MLHLLKSPFYYKPISDVLGDYIFRVNSFSLKYEKNKSNDFDHKKRFLTIFNKKLEIVATVDLNDRNYILSGGFCTNEGFLLPCPNGVDKLRYKVFKIKKT